MYLQMLCICYENNINILLKYKKTMLYIHTYLNQTNALHVGVIPAWSYIKAKIKYQNNLYM